MTQSESSGDPLSPHCLYHGFIIYLVFFSVQGELLELAPYLLIVCNQPTPTLTCATSQSVQPLGLDNRSCLFQRVWYLLILQRLLKYYVAYGLVRHQQVVCTGEGWILVSETRWILVMHSTDTFFFFALQNENVLSPNERED